MFLYRSTSSTCDRFEPFAVAMGRAALRRERGTLCLQNVINLCRQCMRNLGATFERSYPRGCAQTCYQGSREVRGSIREAQGEELEIIFENDC